MIDESEALYEKKDFPAMYDLLIPHKECSDANILWRLARAATEKGKLGSAEERKQHIFEAWGYITKALDLDDNNFACHKVKLYSYTFCSINRIEKSAFQLLSAIKSLLSFSTMLHKVCYDVLA